MWIMERFIADIYEYVYIGSKFIKSPIVDKSHIYVFQIIYKGNILKKIVEYLEHYKETEPKEIERPLPRDRKSVV